RLPTLEHRRLAGHTGGNLLLSMMEQYTSDFLAAVDALRALLGCRGHVWPITVERSTLCAEYSDGSRRRGEFEVDAGQARGDAVGRLTEAIGRPVDVVLINVDPPNGAVLERYAREQKAPLPTGQMPSDCQVIEGAFWRGAIARHDRWRLRAAVWAVLAERMLL